MTDSKKKLWKRILAYGANILLAAIILILIIPSWRNQFRDWFQGQTLAAGDFEVTQRTPFPEDQQNWELVDIKGNLYNFAEFRGKPVVLNFWATWCGPCRAELPGISDLRKNWNDEIAFIAVTTEPPEIVESSGLAEDYDFLYCTQNYPPFFDVRVFPTTAVLDREMNVVFKAEGAAYMNTDNNVDFLNTLLEN